MTHVNWSQALSRKFDRHLRSNKYVNLARVHGKTRASALRYLASIGGYYDHGERWAFSWDVKMHGSMDFDDLYSVADIEERSTFTALCKNDGERGLLYHYMKSVYTKYEREWFNWATEAVWMQFQEDTHTFWGADRDTEFTLAGRSGGHLVMRKCMGLGTARTNAELIEILAQRENSRGRYLVDHEEVVHLFLVAIQTSLDCTHKGINDEVLYRGAFDMWGLAKETEFKELQNVYRYQRASTLQDAFNGDSACANDVRAMLGLPQEKPE